MVDKPTIKGGTFKSVGHLKGMFDKNNSVLIQNIPADGTKVVRFLTEPDEWFAYQEYWDNDRKRYIPVADGVTPPVRPSQRFLAQVVDRESDQVIPLKMAKDLANRLIIRYDRYHTVMDRDYEIMRSGKGLDTTYDVTPEAPTNFEVSKYKKLNLLEILQDAFESAMGNDNALFRQEETVSTTKSDDKADFVEDTDDVEDDDSEDFFEDNSEEVEITEEVNMAEPSVEELEAMLEKIKSGKTLELKVLTTEEVQDMFEELDDDSNEFDTLDEFNEWAWGDTPWTEQELSDMSGVEIKNIMKDNELTIVGSDKALHIKEVLQFQTDYLSDMLAYAKEYKVAVIKDQQ